jgi:Ni2+-binding GTPase involved in maturation of urease and hydrogenase
VRFFQVSCKTGEGVEEWAEWLVELDEMGKVN